MDQKAQPRKSSTTGYIKPHHAMAMGHTPGNVVAVVASATSGGGRFSTKSGVGSTSPSTKAKMRC